MSETHTLIQTQCASKNWTNRITDYVLFPDFVVMGQTLYINIRKGVERPLETIKCHTT